MSWPFGRAVVAVLLPCALGAVAGCGSASVGTPSSPRPTVTPTGPTGPTADAGEAAYPIIVTRMGGIAGFTDTMTVTADHRVRLVRKAGDARTCRIGESAWPRVEAAMSAMVWTPSQPVPTYPDYLSVEIRTPLHGPNPLPGEHPLGTLLTALAAGQPTPDCTAEPGGAS